MKYLLALLVFGLPLMSFGQTKKFKKESLKYYAKIFGEADKDFSVSKSPEKWKDEPVVMLCKKTHIAFLKGSGRTKNRIKGVIRKRVLIQDKSSIADFSEFYFQDADAVGINLIKPNGSVSKVDISSAVKVESEIPKFYADSYHFDEYFKIAIPNLEVGDILDYFKVFTQDEGENIQNITALASTVPIIYQEVMFDVEPIWTFFCNTFNGAPEFEQDEAGGFGLNGKRKKSVQRFILKDRDRAAQKDEVWTYSYLYEPVIKFMAAPKNSAYYDRRVSFKPKVNLKKVFEDMRAIVNSPSTEILRKLVKQNIKKANLVELSDEEKVDAIYRIIRVKFIQQYNTYSAAADKVRLDEVRLGIGVNEYIKMNSNYFTSIFCHFVEKFKIRADAVMAVPRYFGKDGAVVADQEMEFGVYIPKLDKYYWTMDNFNAPADCNQRTFGATAYKIGFSQINNSSKKLEKIVLPSSKFSENINETNLMIKIGDGDLLAIHSENKYTGIYKEDNNNLFLFMTDFFHKEIEAFTYGRDKKKLKEDYDAWDRGYRSKRTQRKKETHGKKNKEYVDLKRDVVEKWLKGDFELEELKDFEVVSYGNTKEDNTLQVNLDFTAKGYIKKAGPNLIFEVGRLIGSQIQLKEEQMKERFQNVEFTSARQIVNNIKIQLPDGLVAQGLDNINKSIDSPNAAFVSTAKQTGNTLEISTKKTYKKETIQKKDWQELVEMLEMAYNFTQQKIILKKQ